MSNKTREMLKVFPFDKATDMESRSEELLRMAFDSLETANHLRTLLRHERFSHHLDRFYKPWGVSLQENGTEKPFVTACIEKEFETVSATVNKDLLKDVTNMELLEPILDSVMKSINGEYRAMHGLDGSNGALLNSLVDQPKGKPNPKKPKDKKADKKSDRNSKAKT